MLSTVEASSEAQAWVEAFERGWRAPQSADAFADHFEPWLSPEIRLVQPMVRPIVGHQAFRERFTRPLFELMPDLRGTVEGWAASGDTVYVELRLDGTLGRRPVVLHSCDRIKLVDGVAVERLAYLDPTPLLAAIALTPRVWGRALRQQLAAWRHSA
jgi:hypothetical protein